MTMDARIGLRGWRLVRWATTALLPLCLGSACGHSKECPSIVGTAPIEAQVFGLEQCAGYQVLFGTPSEVRHVATELEFDTAAEACVTSYTPPMEPRWLQVLVQLVAPNGTLVAEASGQRGYDVECGIYDPLTIEMTVP